MVILLFSAESGTVWMYDADWYNSGDIVPDQVTPASDASPLLSIVSGNVGVSTEYARGDHQHPLQVSTVLPAKDTAVGEEGTANTYARSDHTHHVNLGNSVPEKDTGSGTVGSANVHYSATHQHPLNIDPTTANVPLVNATAAANVTSDYYCRNDHVHPQQLTYDGNVTAIKFIKTGGQATEILCSNADTTTIDNKLSRTYNGSADGWIRLCVFTAGASVGNPFIEFKIYSSYNGAQTIRLVSYFTVNGISTVYEIFNAPTKDNSYYEIEQGANQLFHNHSGSGTSAIYSAYVKLESAGNDTIVVSDQSSYYTKRITEILTQDVVSGVSNGTQIPITYDLANGGIINNMLQVNPIGRTYTTFNYRIRIENYNTEYSSLYLGCSTTAINTTQTDDHCVGLRVSNAVQKTGQELQINERTIRKKNNDEESIAGDYLTRKEINDNYVSIANDQIITGYNPNSTDGLLADQWSIVNTPTGELRIGVNVQFGQDNQGLMISADGNTLTFNGLTL
ncbi:MAG: hypothetical protein EZS28_006154 [Streblomastix strix]|uniref:Uncharacterized protein n=1 Tax=Streblomastix strix TaxID=222440 RepID=A0A5J4WUR9_9EUKA|nr:MAG: hypothetical protein EZS28_006154 [Streblomastix strix]